MGAGPSRAVPWEPREDAWEHLPSRGLGEGGPYPINGGGLGHADQLTVQKDPTGTAASVLGMQR
jgi:hypothetical protein